MILAENRSNKLDLRKTKTKTTERKIEVKREVDGQINLSTSTPVDHCMGDVGEERRNRKTPKPPYLNELENNEKYPTKNCWREQQKEGLRKAAACPHPQSQKEGLSK